MKKKFLLIVSFSIVVSIIFSLTVFAAAPPIRVKEYNGHWYAYIKTTSGATWADAEVAARALSYTPRGQTTPIYGHLVIINDENENNFVKKLQHRRYDAWIGLKYNGTSWEWIDGTPLNYTNWMSGAPFSGEQYTGWNSVVMLYPYGTWSNCNSLERLTSYVVEFEAPNP